MSGISLEMVCPSRCWDWAANRLSQHRAGLSSALSLLHRSSKKQHCRMKELSRGPRVAKLGRFGIQGSFWEKAESLYCQSSCLPVLNQLLRVSHFCCMQLLHLHRPLLTAKDKRSRHCSAVSTESRWIFIDRGEHDVLSHTQSSASQPLSSP